MSIDIKCIDAVIKELDRLTDTAIQFGVRIEKIKTPELCSIIGHFYVEPDKPNIVYQIKITDKVLSLDRIFSVVTDLLSDPKFTYFCFITDFSHIKYPEETKTFYTSDSAIEIYQTFIYREIRQTDLYKRANDIYKSQL